MVQCHPTLQIQPTPCNNALTKAKLALNSLSLFILFTRTSRYTHLTKPLRPSLRCIPPQAELILHFPLDATTLLCARFVSLSLSPRKYVEIKASLKYRHLNDPLRISKSPWGSPIEGPQERRLDCKTEPLGLNALTLEGGCKQVRLTTPYTLEYNSEAYL